MKSEEKEKFYSRYVSAHNAHLYKKTTEREMRRHFPAFEKYYMRFLSNDKSKRIFDFGCGDGDLVHWLQWSGFNNAEGADVSPEQIGVAKSLGIKNVFCEDARKFLANSKLRYDCIFLRDVLGHFEKSEIMDVLDVVYKNLNDNGLIIIKTPNAESPLSGQLRYGDFTHEVSFTRTSLMQIMEVAGFKETKAFGTPPVIHGVKSLLRFVLWKSVESLLRFYRLVDSGSSNGIFTQNVIVCGKKC